MRNQSSCRERQRGAVAIIAGLSLAVLMGFAGLALDGGHLYLTKTELQNAADACALSAAYELTGSPIPAHNFTRAENAGKTVGAENQVNFQGTGIPETAIDVSFAATLNSTNWVSATAAMGNEKHVRCTIFKNDITPWFMQIWGVSDQTVRALATASLWPAQTNCAIPMGLCSQGPASASPPFGLIRGNWYDGRFDAGGGSTGSYNWIDYTPPSGGESELGALLTGAGQCDLNVSTPVGEGGIMGNAAAKAWNSRFGLYQGGPININTATPDFSGYAYTPVNWPSRNNALQNFLAKRAVGAPYGSSVSAGNAVTGLSLINAYNPTTKPEDHLSKGADRRLVTAPIVNCGEWTSSQQIPIRGWACVLMLHPIASVHDTIYMEYLGVANDITSPCSTSGLAGSATAPGPLVPTLVQ